MLYKALLHAVVAGLMRVVHLCVELYTSFLIHHFRAWTKALQRVVLNQVRNYIGDALRFEILFEPFWH